MYRGLALIPGDACHSPEFILRYQKPRGVVELTMCLPRTHAGTTLFIQVPRRW